MAESKNAERKPGLARKLAFSLVSTLVFFGLIEGGLRIARFDYQPRQRLLWKPTIAGFQGTMEYYIQTEFAPPGYIWLSQPNTPYTDRYGFRLPEIPVERVPGRVRVAFLGGSTTQGGYRPYPERAIRLLNAVAGTNRFEMLNVACSSYSTHQSLIALERWVLPRKPDIAMIYHGWNDQNVQSDGFADSDKDALLQVVPKGSGRLAWLRTLKVTQLLGRMVNAVDRTWPRPRVAPEAFRANLERSVDLCLAANVKPLIMVRPRSHRRPLPKLEPVYLQHYLRVYGTENPDPLYQRIFETYTAIQRDVGGRPGAGICDAAAFLDDLQDQNGRKAFGDGIEIFRDDAMHLYEFAEQKLAEQVALTLAPEMADAVRAFVESPDYHEFLAREFLAEVQPYEAVHYAKKAAAADPARAAQMDALIQAAQVDFEFVRLFREGRWGGADPDFDSKIRKLKRCLQMRPSDMGVCSQIFRVCMYMNRPDSAAEAMAGFRPATARDRYEWLYFTFQSHVAGRRWGLAEQAARSILEMNPNDENARAFLQSLGLQ